MNFFRPHFAALLLIGASLFPSSGQAAPGCAEHFANGRMPTYLVAAYTVDTRVLCNEGYAELYSGKTRTALWVGEYLTPSRIRLARGMERNSEFTEDRRLPEAWRSLLADYVHSGYDRGHLAPSGDMPTQQAQTQSFILANIVPQDPNNNRGVWSGVEQSVREYAARRPVYVITGVLFIGQKIGYLHGRVAVPTHLYKVVYDPTAHAAAAYVVANQPQAVVQVVGVAQLAGWTHLDYGWGATRLLALPVPGQGYAGAHR